MISFDSYVKVSCFKRFFFFLQASFVSSKGEEEIDIDDPDFWQKWAKKADLDVDLMNKVVMPLLLTSFLTFRSFFPSGLLAFSFKN